ncbi:unnamed protein product, partial [Closterium sp. NIES-54]
MVTTPPRPSLPPRSSRAPHCRATHLHWLLVSPAAWADCHHSRRCHLLCLHLLFLHLLFPRLAPLPHALHHHPHPYQHSLSPPLPPSHSHRYPLPPLAPPPYCFHPSLQPHPPLPPHRPAGLAARRSPCARPPPTPRSAAAAPSPCPAAPSLLLRPLLHLVLALHACCSAQLRGWRKEASAEGRYRGGWLLAVTCRAHLKAGGEDGWGGGDDVEGEGMSAGGWVAWMCMHSHDDKVRPHASILLSLVPTTPFHHDRSPSFRMPASSSRKPLSSPVRCLPTSASSSPPPSHTALHSIASPPSRHLPNASPPFSSIPTALSPCSITHAPLPFSSSPPVRVAAGVGREAKERGRAQRGEGLAGWRGGGDNE